jgi:phage-related protein
MALIATKKIVAEFFKTAAGNEPVRDVLLKLGRPIKTEIGADIQFVELNWKVDRPYVDQLRQSKSTYEKTIYELRSSVKIGNNVREYRTLFFVYGNRMILSHLFQKKTQKTPVKEVEVAWDRMKLWLNEEIDLELKISKSTRKKVSNKVRSTR